MFSLVYKKIENFLFNNEPLKQLSLMRFILCGTLFYLAFSRQFNMDQYGINSIIPRSEALSIYPEFYRPAIQYFFWPDAWASLVHIVLIGLLLLATLGLSNRILMLITWVLAQGFINRNYSMLFGADLIGTLFLFYLSWTDCHEHFTLKRYFRKSASKIKSDFSQKLTSMVFRLMQIQLAVIYAYTGLEKLKGSTWWDGTALWTVFANPQFVGYDLVFLRNFPIFFSIGTFVTLIFEIYFPAMVMFKSTRRVWLSLGLLFHLGIGLLLSLMPFSLVMVSVYPLFLSTPQIQQTYSKVCLRLGRSRPINES